MTRTNIPEDMPIESGPTALSKAAGAHEGYNFDMQKHRRVRRRDEQAAPGHLWRTARDPWAGGARPRPERRDAAFDEGHAELVDHYVNDYSGFIRAEVERGQDFTTDATNTVNVTAVLRRVGSLLPLDERTGPRRVEQMPPDRPDGRSSRWPTSRSARYESVATADGRFLPLVPPVPNLGAGDAQGRVQVRTLARRPSWPRSIRCSTSFWPTTPTRPTATPSGARLRLRSIRRLRASVSTARHQEHGRATNPFPRQR